MWFRDTSAASATSPDAEAGGRTYLRVRWGFWRQLGFDPALETVYLDGLRQGLRYQSLIAILLGCAIWLLFVMIDIVRLQPFFASAVTLQAMWQLVLTRTLVLLGLGLVLVAMLVGGRYFSYRQHVLTICALYLLALGSMVAVYCYQQLKVENESSVLILVVVAMFLPLGLRFVDSLLLALAFSLTVFLFGLLLVPEAFRPTTLRLALILAMTTGVAGVGAYLREYAHRQQFLLRRDLEWHADHDPLTGLHNRRHFSRHLDACLRQAQRDRRPLALVLIDVDHFKLYNDSYGHQAGDRALKALAQLLIKVAARPLDLAARVGGEGLALIFFDTPAPHAQQLCQDLIRAVQALAIPHASSPTASHVTVSAGCAMLGIEQSEDELYPRADKLLYQAKHQGRNCAVLGTAAELPALRVAA